MINDACLKVETRLRLIRRTFARYDVEIDDRRGDYTKENDDAGKRCHRIISGEAVHILRMGYNWLLSSLQFNGQYQRT